jgi:hypothetical protein
VAGFWQPAAFTAIAPTAVWSEDSGIDPSFMTSRSSPMREAPFPTVREHKAELADHFALCLWTGVQQPPAPSESIEHLAAGAR